jgi:uncharacterized protein (TIGR04255 family)
VAVIHSHPALPPCGVRVVRLLIELAFLKDKDSDKFTDYPLLQRMGFAFQKTPTSSITRETKEKVYQLSNNKLNYLIQLEPDSIVFVFKDYIDYYNFKIFTGEILQKFLSENYSKNVLRLGLRYINTISIPEGNPFDWKDIINDSLIQNLDYVENKKGLTRIMGLIELKTSDYRIKIQYGIKNSDYPNPIAKREYVLDYDCSIEDEMEFSLILSKIDMLHDIIKSHFIKCKLTKLDESMEKS